MRPTGTELLDALESYLPHYFRLLNPILHTGETASGKLNENQIKALMVIRFLGETSPTVISNAVNIQKGSLTTILKSLIGMGLIEKSPMPDNDRSYRVNLTENGRAYIEQWTQKTASELDQLFSKLDDASLTAITEAFRLLGAYLSDIPNRGI